MTQPVTEPRNDSHPRNNDVQNNGSLVRTNDSRARNVGWFAIIVALLVAGVFAIAPSPYVIEEPGPVYDTLGTVTSNGSEVPLISIPTQQTYPTDGSLDLLTVSVFGSPGRTANWFEVATAYFDSSRAVVPVESVFPPELTQEQREQQNQTAMVDSQQDAIAAALVHLGYDFPRQVKVVGLLDSSPAAGILQANDIIVRVNGQDVYDIVGLRRIVQDAGGAAVTVDILRDGQPATVTVTPMNRDGAYVLGVGVTMQYEFPFEVKIQLDNVGGPSAGMMFALGITDKLTPGSLTGGKRIAGTGTIDSAGSVGPIGGIRQKMYGAVNAGAPWFLAPNSNCNEVTGHIPDGLTVLSVKTLDDAIAALDAISNGADTSALPHCPAG